MTLGPPTGTLVGVFEEAGYDQAEAELDHGDLLLLYTDGLSEARAPNRELMGTKTIRRLLGAYSSAPAHFLVTLLLREISSFQNSEPGDDLTLVMIRRR